MIDELIVSNTSNGLPFKSLQRKSEGLNIPTSPIEEFIIWEFKNLKNNEDKTYILKDKINYDFKLIAIDFLLEDNENCNFPTTEKNLILDLCVSNFNDEKIDEIKIDLNNKANINYAFKFILSNQKLIFKPKENFKILKLIGTQIIIQDVVNF